LSIKKRQVSSGQVSVEDSFDAVIVPLLNELRLKREEFPKTIVFTKLKWCGYAHNLALRPTEGGVEDATSIEKFVAQFHAPCTSQVH